MDTLREIKKNRDLINAIDWNMTPEEAVRLYLEWGNNWSGGNYSIRSKNDVTTYFVLNTWDDTPVVYLIQRNSEEASELAKIDLPNDLVDESLKGKKGLYAVDGNLRKWLMEELDAV